jgi:uncharacterized paraquat-inducible protein A
MKTPGISRRKVLQACSFTPLLLLGACSNGRQESAAAACVDPGSLTSSERSLRATVRYTERAENAQQSCKDCVFFHPASADAACGRCDILSGTVNTTGHCISWSARG